MKKFPLLCLFALACAAPALAQNSYRYDNFDTANGIRIETVKTTAVLPPSTGAVRPTAKAIGPQAGANVVRPTPTLYTAAPRGLGMRVNSSLGVYTTGDAKVDTFIVESGVRNGVDPVLLYAQMHTESAFKRGAVSPKGASGLMQLMPGTARRFGVTNIFDPQQNIEGGARYMRYLLDYFGGDVRLALAGYNAGEGAVMKYGRRIPPYRETQEYVRRISLRYEQIGGGQMAQAAHTQTPAQKSMMTTQTAPPTPTFERNVYAVRLPDGRLQLVSQ
ncbi:MAG TPA: lytic transglycosylase domain-containing protein [Pyrinomonadaceae bacterium]|nr:lytic transglycosylase domain-containing protein [Pyrinomonadaceae bacterium]